MKKTFGFGLTAVAITLCAVSALADEVKFSKTAVTVSESAAYAELSVSRTGKSRLRARFATVCGTAVPGREYYATNGILEWAAKKSGTQKIRVRLLPDLVDTWESNKVFQVKLEALGEDELEPGEDAAVVRTPVATVTLKESAKRAPGQISAAAWVDAEMEEVAFANAKKPSLTLDQNDGMTETEIRFDRTGGTDGEVSVSVSAVDGTAKLYSYHSGYGWSGDYMLSTDDEEEEGLRTVTLTWADGDDEPKYVTLASVESVYPEPEAAKKFSLKIAAVKGSGGDKAKVGASSVSVTLRSGLIWADLAEHMKANPAEGLSVKASPGASWYMEDECTVASRPMHDTASCSLTYSLTGPGLFGFRAAREGNGTMTCVYDGKQIAPETSDADGASYSLIRLVSKGKKTAKFTVKGKSVAIGTVGYVSGTVLPEDSMTPCDWMSFASVKPLSPAVDKAIVQIATTNALGWTMPEGIENFYDRREVERQRPETNVWEEVGLRYRVVLDAVKSKLNTAPAFTSIVARTTTCALPEGLLKPATTYYWRVDYLYGIDDELQILTGSTVWSFTTAADGNDRAIRVASGSDARGAAIVPGTLVELRQGVKAKFELATESAGETGSVTYSVAAGKLPTGLKLAKDKSGVWSVSGVPTVCGDFSALIGGKDGKTPCATIALDFMVKPLNLGAGKFGASVRGIGEVPNNAAAVAKVEFTSTAAGKLSAKVALAGKTYSFSGTGFDGVTCAPEDLDPLDQYAVDMLTARLTSVFKANKVSYTNVLEVSLADADPANLFAVGAAAGTVGLEMHVPSVDGKSYESADDGTGLPYSGTLYRDNLANVELQPVLKGFVGYYTLALAPFEPSDSGAPAGNGYLTVTVDDKGKVKLAGALADGTKVSLSSVAYVAVADDTASLSEDGPYGPFNLTVPVLTATKTRCFGGELVLRLVFDGETAEGLAVVDRDAALTWNDTASTACWDETASEWRDFGMEVMPIGGWYDKIVNLQTYYRTTFLTVGPCTGVEEGVEVLLTRNTPSVDKASGVTLKLVRATGVLTGKVGKDSHAGILLLNRTDGFLPENVWSAGALLRSVKAGTKTAKVSEPFNIVGEIVDPDFGAGDEGEWAGEPIPELD